jgi:hypothetical protein
MFFWEAELYNRLPAHIVTAVPCRYPGPENYQCAVNLLAVLTATSIHFNAENAVSMIRSDWQFRVSLHDFPRCSRAGFSLAL